MSPFFGNFIRYPSFHSVGTFSCSQIFRNRWYNIYAVVIRSVFSGGMPSGLGVCPSFYMFSILLCSAFESGFVFVLLVCMFFFLLVDLFQLRFLVYGSSSIVIHWF